MNFTDYQRLALRTEKPLPTMIERLNHAALGLVTETGEITTEVKRMVIYGKPLDALRRAHIAEEVGDTMWYMAIAVDALGMQLADLPTEYEGIESTAVASLGYAALGIAGSVGSAASIVGYALYAQDPLEDKRELKSDLINTWRGLHLVASVLGIPLTDIGAANIAKLQLRFPDAYSNEAAEARADKGGADARNS